MKYGIEDGVRFYTMEEVRLGNPSDFLRPVFRFQQPLTSFSSPFSYRVDGGALHEGKGRTLLCAANQRGSFGKGRRTLVLCSKMSLALFHRSPPPPFHLNLSNAHASCLKTTVDVLCHAYRQT